jgi:predicted PurR-regulated permease PerM
VVPVWLDRLTAIGWRVLAVSALGIVIVAIALILGTVTASVLLALVVAAPLVPVVARLRARGLNRSIASAITCLAGLAGLLVVVVLIVVAFLPYLREIVRLATDGLSDVGDDLAEVGAPSWLLLGFEALSEAIRSAVVADIGVLVGGAITVGTVLVLAGFLLFFLLQDGDRGWAWAMAAFEPWQARMLTGSATAGMDRVGSYVRRTIALAAADAIVAFVLLAILGVPFTGPLTAMVFLFGFVPYLGGIVATVVVALATLSLAGPSAALAVVLGLVAAAILENRALAGTEMGTRGAVHPALVLLAVPAGAALFGVFGLLLAVPVTLFVITVIRPLLDTLDFRPAMAAATRPGGPSWAVPGWLDRLAQWSWRGLVVVAMVVIGIRLILLVPVIVVPIVLAIVIAATLLPLVNLLLARGWSRGAAAAATTVGATVVIVASVLATIVWTVGPMREITSTAMVGAQDIDAGWLTSAVREVAAFLSIGFGEVVRAIVVVGLGVVLLLLLTFFFLRDGGAFWDEATEPLRGARRDHLDEAGERAVGVLSGYMVGTALISLFGAVTSALIMVILGLPLALPIGILTFFGGFIPYIGSFVTTALAFLIAVAVGTTADIVIMFVYTIVFNLIQGSYVAPIVYGRALSLHPAIVLVAVPVGSAVAGILGMFLVVPVVAIVSATWRLVVATIEDDSPAPEPAADATPTDAGGPGAPSAADGPERAGPSNAPASAGT